MTEDPEESTRSVDPESRALWQTLADRYGWHVGVFSDGKVLKVEMRKPGKRYVWETR